MHKYIFVFSALIMLTSCSAKLDYNSVLHENSMLKAENSKLIEQISDLTHKLESTKSEDIVKVRVVGGFTGVVNNVVSDWMNGHSDQYGYRYYVTVTPFQLTPVLINVISKEPLSLGTDIEYYFGLMKDDSLSVCNQPFTVSKNQIKQVHAPFPPKEYWFDCVKTPLGAEDGGVNSFQFFWEEVL